MEAFNIAKDMLWQRIKQIVTVLEYPLSSHNIEFAERDPFAYADGLI